MINKIINMITKGEMEVVEEGSPLCNRCKFGRLEPIFSNVLKGIEYPYGRWKCANCQIVYEFRKAKVKGSE